MNCNKCGNQLSMKKVCQLRRSPSGEIKFECIQCPKFQLLEKAYIQYCQSLQVICDNSVELNNALVCAHQALEWAKKA